MKDGLVPEKIAPFMEDEKWLSMTPEELADAMKEVEQKEETEAAPEGTGTGAVPGSSGNHRKSMSG